MSGTDNQLKGYSVATGVINPLMERPFNFSSGTENLQMGSSIPSGVINPIGESPFKSSSGTENQSKGFSFGGGMRMQNKTLIEDPFNPKNTTQPIPSTFSLNQPPPSFPPQPVPSPSLKTATTGFSFGGAPQEVSPHHKSKT
jgi:hypothetical protein